MVYHNTIINSLTKGQTLCRISENLDHKLFSIPKLYLLKSNDWFNNKESCLSQITKTFNDTSLVVRSSASDEDSVNSSKAGEYCSVLDVPSTNDEMLKNAIDRVIDSYVIKGLGKKNQEVLIQSMVNNVVCSGVIFTHELNTGAPYYVVNYDDTSGSTDSVTSGSGDYSNRTLYIHRSSSEKIKSPRFSVLIDAVRELEIIIGCNFLDIEFAVDENFKPFLLQVRYITTQPNWNRSIVRSIDSELSCVNRFLKNRFQRTEGVFGNTTVFGQMPDWNPAEMIGRAPRALSFSLYRKLITDRAWSDARKLMGYAIPVGQPLMVSLGGQPYIDTRLSFHSYLPADLPNKIASKLVDEWVERLKQKPELHDKVEFDVAVTTYSFDIDERLDLLATSLGSDEKEVFKTKLLGLLHPLLTGKSAGSIKSAIDQINCLHETPLPKSNCGIGGLFKIIDECISLGTIPFSILARHGFIARNLYLA